MRKQSLLIIASIVLAAGLITAALLLGGNDPAATAKDTANQKPRTRTFTATQLTTFDGKDGRACYVAVNGKVYEIEQGRLWEEGQHTPSGSQAMCGKDVSDVIGKSPHGTSKLSTLEVVGTLTSK